MSTQAFVRLIRTSFRGRRLLGTVMFVAVVALASTAFVIGIVSRQDAGRLWDRAFDDASGPHVTLRAVDADALADAVDDAAVVASSDPVAANGTLSLLLDVEAVDDEAVEVEAVEVDVRSADADRPPEVGAPSVVEGRLALDPTEAVVEQSFADDLGIGVGDSISIGNETSTATFDVVGLVLDFNDCFYPQCDPGVIWMTPEGLESFGPQGRYLETYVRLADPDSAPAFVAATLRDHADRLTGSQDWLDTRGDALSVNEFFGAFLSGFGVFVIIAAGIVVAGSVTNRVLARRRDIGLLKAVGVTPAQVVSTVLVEHLLLGVVAVVTGWVLGSLLAPLVQIGVTEVLDPAGVSWAVGPLVLVAVVVTAIITVATVLPSLRVARATTTSTLRPPADPGRSSWPARAARRLGAGPVVLGGVKDVVQRPLRTVLAGLSIVLAVIALVITLGFRSTIAEVTGHPDLTGDPWDFTVVPAADTDHAALVAAIEGAPDVAGWFGESEGREVVDGDVVLVRSVAGDPEAAAYVVREGRNMVAAGEGLAGFGLLERLDRQVGDTVTVELDGVEIPVLIVGRYSEVEDSGDVLLFRAETLAPVFPDVPPALYRVVATPGVAADTLAAELATVLGDEVAIQPLVVETDDLDAFAIAFWMVAGLVLVVALANLGATILLSVRERMRDFGVLRTIGYTPSQLVASTAIGTALLAVASVAVGLPVGVLLSRSLLGMVGEAMGAGPELRAAPSWGATVVVLVLVLLLATVIGAATCVRASRQPVSELVTYE